LSNRLFGVSMSPRRLVFFHAALLLLIGIAYRATFIQQGFNGSDEAWLPALAQRVNLGQVPYRDFYYGFPLITLYKEAGLMALLGDNYSYLASRWAFALEMSLASALAYLVVLRFTQPWRAFWATLPTVFFTTILYYYSNFNQDAVFLFLGSLAVLVWAGERRTWIAGAGVLCGLALLAKPTTAPLAILVCAIGLLRPWLLGDEEAARIGAPAGWIWFAVGFAAVAGAVTATLAVVGLLGTFIDQSFLVLGQAHPLPLRFLIYQDWPHWLVGGQRIAAFAIVLALALVLVPLGRRRPLGVAAVIVVAAVLLAALIPAAPSSTLGIPTFSQMEALVAGLGLLLSLNAAAFLVTMGAALPTFRDRPWCAILRRELFPPQLPLLAFSVQLLQDYSVAGMRFSYVGTFLSIPTALLFVHGLARIGAGFSANRWTAVVLGVWLAATGTVILYGSPYLDGPRSRLTASFAEPQLAGLRTLPANAERVDATVALLERYSKPNEPVFVFPDGQAYYFLTKRRNPTRTDWYDLSSITPALAREAAGRLAADPPAVILIQEHQQNDFLQTRPALDFESEPRWSPIYDWIQANYRKVGTVGTVDVYLPR
jgi:hypothetical protein